MTCFSAPYVELYDALYSDKNYSSECDFLEELFQVYRGPDKARVLDFGCGTGNHSLELATRGYEVVGVDASEAMVERAREKARSWNLKTRFETQLSPDWAKPGSFDVVLSLFSVLNYLNGREEVIQQLSDFAVLLPEDGLVILETWNGDLVPSLYESQRTKKVNRGDQTILRETQSRIDTEAQRMEVEFRCFVGNEKDPRVVEAHKICYYTSSEFSSMAREAGLEIKATYPSFKLTEPGAEDYNLIYLCTKKDVS